MCVVSDACADGSLSAEPQCAAHSGNTASSVSPVGHSDGTRTRWGGLDKLVTRLIQTMSVQWAWSLFGGVH